MQDVLLATGNHEIAIEKALLALVFGTMSIHVEDENCESEIFASCVHWMFLLGSVLTTVTSAPLVNTSMTFPSVCWHIDTTSA